MAVLLARFLMQLSEHWTVKPVRATTNDLLAAVASLVATLRTSLISNVLAPPTRISTKVVKLLCLLRYFGYGTLRNSSRLSRNLINKVHASPHVVRCTADVWCVARRTRRLFCITSGMFIGLQRPLFGLLATRVFFASLLTVKRTCTVCLSLSLRIQ